MLGDFGCSFVARKLFSGIFGVGFGEFGPIRFQAFEQSGIQFADFVRHAPGQVFGFSQILFQVVQFVNPFPKLDQFEITLADDGIGTRGMTVVGEMPDQGFSVRTFLSSAFQVFVQRKSVDRTILR